MDIAAILFNGAEPYEQIGNTLSTEGHMWNLVKIARVVSEKMTFKNYTILYMHIAQGQGQITPMHLYGKMLKKIIFLMTDGWNWMCDWNSKTF